MAQQTLQLYEDCRKVMELLGRKDAPPEVAFGPKKVKRRFSEAGYPLIHAAEVYGNPAFGITEKRAFSALNELVSQGKVRTHHFGGLIWYSMDPHSPKA